VGVDPIHFGIIFVVACEMAFLTPPYGVNLVVISGMTGLKLEKVALAALPYMLALLICMVVVAFFPEISLFLPRLVGLIK